MITHITLRHRAEPVAVTNDALVRVIVDAVSDYSAGRSDEQFRIPRSRNRAIRFRASDITAIKAKGIDLTCAPNPAGNNGLAVAA